MLSSDPSRYVISTGIAAERFDDVMALYRSAWWSAARAPEDVRRLLAGPSLFFVAAERDSGRLVAMARAITDGVYKAMVFDVIVLPEHQGARLGRSVMDELLAHPSLRDVQHVELYCLPEIEPFYERWGFTGEIGGVRLIRRTLGPGSRGMSGLGDPSIWISLATLTALEIVLGVDNIIFITILAGKLAASERDRARRVGLALAMLTRIALLVSLTWVIRLTEPLFAVWGQSVSGRDLILVGGGLFLLAKSTLEIHEKLEGEEGEMSSRVPARFGRVVVQIALLDIVFSLDSVITAVGMARQISVMIAAVVISVAIMFFYAAPLGAFVDRHPTVKILALSFLLLIGMSLVADGLHHHVPKGYLYFAMGFAVLVEALNLRLRARRAEPVHLREPYVAEPERFGGPFDAAGR